MARHKRKSKKALETDLGSVAQLVAFIGVLIAVGSIISFLNAHSDAAILGLFALLAVGGLWLLRRAAVHRRFERHFQEMLTKHEHALLSCYRQSIYQDPFGNRVDARWKRDIDTFLRTQVVLDETVFVPWRKTETGQRVAKRVDQIIEVKAKAAQEAPTITVSVMDLRPLEYERLCADLLRRRGWEIQMTPPTGDGGADFVAQKHAHRVVVQCKRYAKPVGNTAVQEVNSAVRLYSGTVACVVAPNGFTSQARREAFALNIRLLDHDDLQAFADQIEAGSLHEHDGRTEHGPAPGVRKSR